ncbi:MAG TPA: NAD-glutamate dehydrogenase, partial [Rhodospirillaceae bacterium]|nr:NAD-glutamate dehydrogenase [Rhodospirillaceae bacterium]
APWQNQILSALNQRFSNDVASKLDKKYREAFSLSFQESHTPESAIEDIISVEKLLNVQSPVVMAFTSQKAQDGDTPYHLSFYHEGDPISPLKLLRIVENFGLTPVSDSHYTCEITVEGQKREIHIHDFPIQVTADQWVKLDPRQDAFEEALQAIWQNLAGNDRLNELLFLAEMTLPEVVLVRAIGRYLMQARLPYSQDYYAEILTRHAPIVRLLTDYFHARFDPDNHSEAKAAALLKQCENYIAQVKSLDEDRVLRRVLNFIQATVRTNYYQRDSLGMIKPQLSFKINSAEITELPKPVPLYETFVYAHRVEGIHLRTSKISRGGLRWSDRREDFRDEVLDLMKAQTVKNSVIVPTGAKGGFYVKYPPLDGDRKAIQAEGIACYQIFIRGLLDITDNWVNKEMVRPRRVVCYDEPDPYLVVAADKGTATFSDIANAISKDYNHWLGDAFASGGSVGYDHKGMGITARGAWESVRHHGYLLGINVDKDPITVVGVGDMGGDVFGNGLLQSPHLKLIGAFSYSHIFCDPHPDPAKSFAERTRLFKAVANWDQYNPALLSKGGRIYSRGDKELELTPEIKAAFGIENDKVTPAELMRAILRAQVDLLWFGGIGTYVKASTELDVDVRDKANDFIRITGNELRCKIIGEGANLGMTQRGRIEADHHGVALNTDFIDNSAGVNTSDYEVNIKILLNALVSDGKLTMDNRNKLLESMTDEIAALVLANNRAQNTALGIAREMSPGRTEHFGQLIEELENLSGISRKLEALPTEADLARMAIEGQKLTRPEISVIMSHTKLLVTQMLAQDNIVDDPALLPLLHEYFPAAIVKKYPEAVNNFALKQQLVAMLLANAIVNQASVYMPKWLSDRTGLGYADIARSFVIANALFEFEKHWNAVQALENVPSEVQQQLLIELLQHTDRSLPWFLNQNELLRDISGTIARYQPHFVKLSDNILSLLPPERRHARNNHEQRLIAEGVPVNIAAAHANIRSLAAVPSVIALALDIKKPVVDSAKIYFQIGERFGFDQLREQARQSMRNEYWQRQAISALIEDFSAHQLRLTRAVLTQNQTLQQWIANEHQLAERLDVLMRELHGETSLGVTQLTVANRRLRGLVPSWTS